MGVRVVTDSSAVIPPQWLSGIPLHVVPLQLAWPDGTASEDRPYSELAPTLTQGRKPPKTSAPSPGAYEELFSHLLATDDALEGVLARALDVASRVQIWATLTQLDFLRRSGRVPAVAAIGAGALRLQPIVRYSGGSPTPVGITRSARRGAERVFRAWQKSIGDGTELRLVAFHCERGDEADGLCMRVLELAPKAGTAVVEVPASLASHTGPGLLGLGWLWDP
jgi:fatty acid-binding protein DegV